MQTQDLDLGFLARPDAGAAPGVVLVPDVWGLSDLYRRLAQRLAEEGFCALAVDLYRRSGPPEPGGVEEAQRIIRGLDDRVVLADVQEAIDALAGRPDVRGGVGITGFCVGGQQALLAACLCRGLSACAAFYGMVRYGDDQDPALKPHAPIDVAGRLTCPVIGLYGEEDPLIPVADVRAFEEAVAKTGRPHAFHLYPGAGHAFLNDARPQAYRPEAAADAWGKAVAFLREHLGA